MSLKNIIISNNNYSYYVLNYKRDTKLSVIDRLLLILKSILCVESAMKGQSVDVGGLAKRLQQSRLRKVATWIRVAELGTDLRNV